MANAKMCDRCGAYYCDNTKIWMRSATGEKVYIVGAGFILNNHEIDNYVDLCPKCIKDLMDFLHAYNAEKETESEKKEESNNNG